MRRGHDILALGGDGEDDIADGRHAGVVSRHVRGARQFPHPVFQIRHRRILHARIVRRLGAAGKGIGDLLCIREFVRHIRVNGHRQGAVGVGACERRMEGNCLFLHCFFSVKIGCKIQTQKYISEEPQKIRKFPSKRVIYRKIFQINPQKAGPAERRSLE